MAGVGDGVTLAPGGVSMNKAGRTSVAVCAAALLFLVACGIARGQEAQLDALAKQVAGSLAKANARQVVVLDFAGDADTDALGEKLAADFRAALVREGGGVKVEDRLVTMERVNDAELVTGNLRDGKTVKWLYRNTAVNAWISGALARQGESLKLIVQIHPEGTSTANGEFTTTIPLLDDLKALIHAPEADEFAWMPRGGANGLSAVKCISCPSAVYSEAATRAQIEGTVILTMTIEKSGRVKDIRVKQGLPFGLTQQAIDAVEGWKYLPARNARNKKVQVRQEADVSFVLK